MTKSIKVTVGQINPTIGDFTGNIDLMLKAARKARLEGAELVVFPELSLTGYYPGDLLDEPHFQARLREALEQLKLVTRETPHLAWVVGAPLERDGVGKKYHNGLLVLQDGQERMRYAKQLLPTYNVFDERRHFEPGPDKINVVKFNGVRVAFLTCEDGWNDEGQDYAVNPFERIAAAAPDLVVSINASPSNIGKRDQRHEVFGRACARHKLPLLYVNQVGGHDQLVYDGASFAVDAHGKVAFEANRFVTDVATLSFDATTGAFSDEAGNALPPVGPGLSTMEFYRRQIVLGLRDYARRCGFSQVVVGSSGGIDSAVTIALAAEALGANNVSAITMPSKFSSTGSVTDSEVLCQNLGIRMDQCPIGEIVSQYEGTMICSSIDARPKGLALENLQARVRGTLLMTYSNMFGHLLLTTGNKSEISVGYCTLYGDTNGGLGLIGDLYKTEVFELARHINATAGREVIPQVIIDKEPSAELAPDQKDSDSLPPYEVLDAVLKHLLEGERLSPEEAQQAHSVFASMKQTPEGLAIIARVQGLIARSEYKRRQAPPVVRVRARAFGVGRQVPVCAKQF